MEKNIANQKFRVFAFNITTGAALSGDAANITAKLKIDSAALAGTNDVNPTEIETGYYEFDALQAETNGKEILIVPVSSTANIEVIGVPGLIVTEAPNSSDLGIESDGDLTKVNTVDDVTNNVTADNMRGTDGANTVVPDAAGVAATPSEVNEQMLDVLTVDTFSEVGKEAPAATTSILKMIQLLYKSWRNKKDVNATTEQLYNDAGAVVDQERTVSDDTVTATKGEMTIGS